ncbi:MAG: UDP-glucose dehydrogenase family protein [Opitutales bacterium]
MLNIVVLGLGHLGCVTAACLARHHRVTGLDFDEPVLAALRRGQAPVHEPGLDALLASGLASGHLTFGGLVPSAPNVDLVWICYDTPVDAGDNSDVAWVMARIARVLRKLPAGKVVLLSSQLPVGTCAALARQYPKHQFASSPENLRLGRAIEAFEHPARIVVGAAPPIRHVLETILAPLGAPILWMRPESAEMVKHALNGFLALSIAYINEIATLSATVGADALEVAAALKSDPRIGSKAYLSPGGPFAGGTLARDVVTLTGLGQTHGLPLHLVSAIKTANDCHRGWVFRQLQTALRGTDHPVIAILGLTYTPGTSTLRRSASVELIRELLATGAQVRAYDPVVRTADAEHRDLPLVTSVAEALHRAHAVVICTEWPALRELAWPELLAGMSRPIVVDANRLVENAVAAAPGVVYLTVGRP